MTEPAEHSRDTKQAAPQGIQALPLDATYATPKGATKAKIPAMPGLARGAKVAPEPEPGTVPDDSLENYKNPAWKRPFKGEYNAKPVAGKLKTGSTEDKRQEVRNTKASEQDEYDKAAATAKAEGKPAPKKPGLHQPVDDLGEIYAHAGMLKAQFEERVEAVAGMTGGKCSFRPGEGMKSINRAKEKIDADYNKDASRLIDATGMSVAYQSPEELIKGFQAIDNLQGIKVVKVKNSAAKADGYGDVNLTVEMGGGDYKDDQGQDQHWDGFLIELQLHLQGMLDKKKTVHKQYEGQRKIEADHTVDGKVTNKETWSKSDQKKHATLDADMKKKYGEVWNQYAGGSPEELEAMRDKLKKGIPERG